MTDSDFVDNYGSAITAYTRHMDHVLIIFSGTVLLRNNTSHRGGAIHLYKSRIGLRKDVHALLSKTLPKMLEVQYMYIQHSGSVVIMKQMLETMVIASMCSLTVTLNYIIST